MFSAVEKKFLSSIYVPLIAIDYSCFFVCLTSLVAQTVKASAYNVGDPGSIPGSGTLEKEIATHSSTLAWKIPWTEKPGRGRKESNMTE